MRHHASCPACDRDSQRFTSGSGAVRARRAYRSPLYPTLRFARALVFSRSNTVRLVSSISTRERPIWPYASPSDLFRASRAGATAFHRAKRYLADATREATAGMKSKRFQLCIGRMRIYALPFVASQMTCDRSTCAGWRSRTCRLKLNPEARLSAIGYWQLLLLLLRSRWLRFSTIALSGGTEL